MDSVTIDDHVCVHDDAERIERAVAQRTARLQDTVQGLERFCAQVAHDLRDVLGGIAGLAELAHQSLLERHDDRAALSALPLIAQQAQRSALMLHGLLRLARTRDAPLQLRSVDVSELAGQVAEEVALCRCLRQMPAVVVRPMPMVVADPDLLHAVLYNLVSNAVKFTRDTPGGRIDIDGIVAGDRVLTICVRDNGVGFDRARASALFQPFGRLHGARYDGCGIGLTIVRSAVERHGGVVWADAAPGEGARFYFTLPLA